MGEILIKPSNHQLLQKIEELQIRLNEAEETLAAIRNGEVDAIIVSGEAGEKVFTLTSAETPYRIILEEMSEGAAISKSDGTILYFNHSFADILTTTTEPVVGHNILSFVSDDERPKLLDLLKIGLKDKASCIISFYDQQKNRKYLNFSVKPLPTQLDGDLCIIISDMTKIYLYQNHLNELVNERTIKIKKANTKLKANEKALLESENRLRELNATKDKLFSILTHDLKGPFTSIVGFSDLLIENIRKNDFRDIENFAEVINESSNNAMNLLANLIEWSSLQTGRIKLNPKVFEINTMISEVLDLLFASAQQKSIIISSDVPSRLSIFADKLMISTVLRNLISNAIKFSNPEGEILISAEKKESEVMVKVTDNGIGMNRESIEKLFNLEVYFSTPGTQNEKGTGLGMVICYEFITKHDGKIWVESEIGKGTSVIFTLPSKTN